MNLQWNVFEKSTPGSWRREAREASWARTAQPPPCRRSAPARCRPPRSRQLSSPDFSPSDVWNLKIMLGENEFLPLCPSWCWRREQQCGQTCWQAPQGQHQSPLIKGRVWFFHSKKTIFCHVFWSFLSHFRAILTLFKTPKKGFGFWPYFSL